MECNKDEAIRAKSIAEAKLAQKDFAGAKKFASKAQNLYPGLDGISQMLTTLDVYVSTEKKISGQIDYYGVLGVSPSADEETIKKQYRKLALGLHPDKNKSVGAEGAFKIISEAWSLLSDKAKRSVYNQITGFNKGYQQKVPTHTGGPSTTFSSPSAHAAGPWPRYGGPPYANTSARTSSGPTAHNGGPPSYTSPSARSSGPSVHNGGPSSYSGPSARTSGPSAHNGGPSTTTTESPFSKFAHRKAPAPKSQKKSAKTPSKPSPSPIPPQRTDTFWTICHQCKIQYEYHRKYCKSTLLCPTCKKAFVAVEIPRPVGKSKSQKPTPWPQKNQNSSCNLRTPTANGPRQDVPNGQNSGAGQPGQNIPTNSTYQRGPPTSSAGVNSADPSTAAKVSDSDDKLKRKTTFTESKSSAGMEGYFKKRKLDESNFKVPERNVDSGSASKLSDSSRELTQVEMRKLLMKAARKEILKRLNEPSSEGPADKEKHRTKERQRHQKRKNTGSSADKPSEQNSGTATMNVPDPDFYDFDQDRTENSFSENEVWAAYDDDDGMPRFYALINKVISKNPFRLKISWLNSKTTTEFGSLDWVGSGFYKTCGEFWVGKHEICKFVNAFSQRVNWSKGPRGSVLIYPHKGDMWALYRNWSSEWSTSTGSPPDNGVVHAYEMVAVLDEYDEEKGVCVAPLMKVGGFRTVFCPNVDPKAVRKIPREEMLRFSHMVPHHSVTRQEAPNVPEGCVELDPAATPLELLQMSVREEKEAC